MNNQTSLLGDPPAEGEVDVHQLELLLAGVRPDVADAGHGALEGGRAQLLQLPRRRDVARRLRLAPHPPDVLLGRQVGVDLDDGQGSSSLMALADIVQVSKNPWMLMINVTT